MMESVHLVRHGLGGLVSDVFEVRPIGMFHTGFSVAEGTPVQGAFVPDAEGVVEVHEEYADGLDGVEEFSHLLLLYLLHRADGVDLRPVPFLDDQPHGIFATRYPRRPNHVAICVVRLERREGRRLYVRNVDALDGSPVVDIKPYVPTFDSVPDAVDGWYAARLR